MSNLACLEMLLRRLLIREFGLLNGDSFHGDASTEEDIGNTVCPALWIVSELIALVEEFRDRQIRDLAPMVRRMLMEQSFVNDNGDSILDGSWEDQVQEHVEKVLRALEIVKQEAESHGLWGCNEPAAQFFG